MLRLEREQQVCRIGGVAVGGQPGENPPVLIGSLFHKGDRLLHRRLEHDFDRAGARDLLKRQEELSRQTGIPSMVDIVGNTGDELKAYIDFVAGATTVPFCLDAWKLQPRLEAARYAAGLGLLDRVIYNSVSPWSEDIEREAAGLAEIGVKHVVLVAFDPEDQMPAGRLGCLERLLKALEGVPLESILVDTSVMNLPATAFCSLANRMVKERYGLPAGSAPANGTYMWKEARQTWGGAGFAGVDTAVHAVASVLWHDFLFYGPLVAAGRMFPAVAAAAAVQSTLIYGEGGPLPSSPEHPLNRLFADFAGQLSARSQSQTVPGG
ncbi:MAG: tetrahydromethanopterin S-methyltransferase subunit H [Dehalococcoidia bacterium]